MKTLKVTSDWLFWFHSEKIEIVSTIDNREMLTTNFEGKIDGDKLNYITVFKLIDTIIEAFCFLKIEKIRLNWTENIEKDNLQFFEKNSSYHEWKECVLKGPYNIENSYGLDYEDSVDIYFNYLLDVNKQIDYLYNFGQTDKISIYLLYNPNLDITNYKIKIELRKALFYHDSNFNKQLTDVCLKNNETLFIQVVERFSDQINLIY